MLSFQIKRQLFWRIIAFLLRWSSSGDTLPEVEILCKGLIAYAEAE